MLCAALASACLTLLPHPLARAQAGPAASAASAPDPGSPAHPLQQLAQRSEDDPAAARAEALRLLVGEGAPLTRFWLHLAAARASALLEDPPEHRRHVALAEAELEAAGATPELRLWLEHEQLSAAIGAAPPAELLRRLAALRDAVRARPLDALRCDVLALAAWMLASAESLDEAWIAAEELEPCSAATGLPRYERAALARFGHLTGLIRPVDPQGRVSEDAAAYFDRALATLGTQPARFRRSVLEYDLGVALAHLGHPEAARERFERAHAASRALGDLAGAAAAAIELAKILLAQDAPRAALPLLREAIDGLTARDDGIRLASALRLRILALARLKDVAVLAEVDRAREIDKPALQPAQRAALALAMAEGLASQGQHAAAYAEMQRAHELQAQARELARDAQLLHLQARYQAARRDAENADLRHRDELSRLALEAQHARQSALWAALVMLLAIGTVAAGFAWRLLRRRRALADLALKDELTGAPNRRSVAAYAQAQVQQSRELGLPLTVAMIDLDHFKRVNDEHGHATGDALLCAFAASAAAVLRGQDRIGRWGGEEWMLVMPGTRLDELPRVFERLQAAYAQAPVPGMPVPHGCSFSMGGASLGDGSPNLDTLIARADACLYQAKHEGRARLCLEPPPSRQSPSDKAPR